MRKVTAKHKHHSPRSPPASAIPGVGQFRGVPVGNGVQSSTQPATSTPPANRGKLAFQPGSIDSSAIPTTSTTSSSGDHSTTTPLSGNYIATAPPMPVNAVSSSAVLSTFPPAAPATHFVFPSQSSLVSSSSTVDTVATPSTPGSGGNYPPTSTSGLPDPVGANASSATLDTSTTAAPATYFLFPSQSSLDSSSSTFATDVSSSTTFAAAATSSGKHLSGGAIAGIIITCLISLLTLILMIVRRRSIARRVELRKQWWLSRNASRRSVLSVNNPRSPVASNGSRTSARSSFATNFDHGLMFGADPPSRTIVPDLPPIAEVRERNAILISTGAAVARRESMNSMLSTGSDPDANSSTGHNKMGPSTPMFVSPFSPSESFAFPKPPTSSRSSATIVQLSTPPRAFMTDLPPVSVKTPTSYPQTSAPSLTLIPPTDPFVDPCTASMTPRFADFEVIRRPFEPSMYDEVAVHPGDRVRILDIFDDGWTFVDKLASKGGRNERGLIPVDCLRDAGQTLPTFLVRENVHDCGSDELIGAAL